MKKKTAKPQLTEPQRFKINRAAAKALSRLRKETCLAPPGSISLEEWRECLKIIAKEMTKVAFVEIDSKFYRDLLEQIAANPRRTRAQRLASSRLRFIDAAKAEAAKPKPKPLTRSIADSGGNPVAHGDRIRFNYGIPPVCVTAKVVQHGNQLIALTPGHNPKESNLRSLRRYVGEWFKV